MTRTLKVMLLFIGLPFLLFADQNVNTKVFKTKTLINPQKLKSNPYSLKNRPEYEKDAFCALKFTDSSNSKYELKTFENRNIAKEKGYKVTHQGNCGTCSTLQDLAVYLDKRDLTTPVRKCSLWAPLSREITVSCLEKIGFSHECAKTWYYNAHNTFKNCFWVCAKSWIKGEGFNKPDGTINDCLKCDEEKSGPVFKATAGRTRRNSGIESAIKRGDEEVANIKHDYLE